MCVLMYMYLYLYICVCVYIWGGSEVIDGSHLPSTLALFFETWSFNEPEAFLFH